MLNQACLNAAFRVLGRSLSQREINEIERELAQSMRILARRDPRAWLAKSADQQKVEAATYAAQQILARQQKKRADIARTIRVRQEIDSALAQMEANGVNNIEGVQRYLLDFRDHKTPVRPVDLTIQAIETDALSQLIATWDASSPRFFGLFANRQAEHLLARELGHEVTGNAIARAGAKAYHDVMEALRLRDNAAGGNIAKLDNYDYPHHHSQALVANAGGNTGLAARDYWISRIWNRLDRRAYVNEDGSFMDDTQYRSFLQHAWETIATEGASTSQVRSSRYAGDAHRQLHFSSPADYIQYQKEFGERTLYDVLVSSVYGIARDIGLKERLGPDPQAMFRYVLESAYKKELQKNPHLKQKLERQMQRTQQYFDALAGKPTPVDNQMIADVFQTARYLTYASKMGSAPIAAFYGDMVTSVGAARLDNLPKMRFLRNYLKALTPFVWKKDIPLARAAGLGLRAYISELNRFGQEVMGGEGRAPRFFGKLANASIRVTGLTRLTAAEQRGYGMALMSNFAHLTNRAQTMARLGEGDRRILQQAGVTESHWKVWRAAIPENWGGSDNLLTAASIYRIPDAELAAQAVAENTTPLRLKQEAATQLIATTLRKVDVGVIEPSLKQRVTLRAGLRRGDLLGELGASFLQFKNFMFSLITSHWNRAMSLPPWQRARYLVWWMFASQLAGMAILWTKDLLSGNDLRDYDPSKEIGRRNILAGLLAGGGLGPYGDFLFQSTSRHGKSVFETLAGPTVAMGQDVWDLLAPSSWSGEDIKDKPAAIVKLGRSNLPLLRTWYTKAALDHWIFNQLQDAASPGYLRRAKSRAYRIYGTESWWEANKMLPDRTPEFSKAYR